METGAILTPSELNEIMDAPSRRVYGRVEIVYTDPFNDPTVVVTSNGYMPYGAPEQATKNLPRGTKKWFTLSKNKLDGTYFPIPVGTDEHVGWWSNKSSDALGNMTVYPTLTLEFPSRTFTYISVAGDDVLGNYPVNFDITIWYDDEGVTKTFLHQVRNNTSPTYKTSIDPITHATKIELKILKISLPNSLAVITDFYSVVKETYDGNDIIYLNLLEEQEFDSSSLPIGNISANEITVRLMNKNNKFSVGNLLSPLNGLLHKNRKITAWLGVDTQSGIDWFPLGIFWSTDWKSPDSEVWVETTGLDMLEIMRTTFFIGTDVTVNGSLGGLLQYVLEDYGLTNTQYIIDSSLYDTVVPYAWLDKGTHRDALTTVATAGLARVYCDRQGRIVIKVSNPYEQAVYTFDRDKSLVDIEQPLSWSTTKNLVEIKATSRKLKPLETLYDSTESFTIPANSKIQHTYEFSSKPVHNVQAVTFPNGANGVTVTNYEKYCWGVVVEYDNPTASAVTITAVKIDGQVLEEGTTRTATVRDETSILENGTNSYSMSNPLIQSYELAYTMASNILSVYSNPKHDIKLTTRGHIGLSLGDRVMVPMVSGPQDCYISRQEINWDGALDGKVDAKRVGV